MAQHRDSLQRPGMSYVDALTIHDLDFGVDDEEQIEAALSELSPKSGGGATALEDLRASGMIKAIGVGCNRGSHTAQSWNHRRMEDLIDRIADGVDLDFIIWRAPTRSWTL